jgi:ssDNA-binding Zn-finger/Zn-ribbon topoisomerase 1
MQQGTKKIVMACIIVGCLAAAGIITYKGMRSSYRGIETIERGQLIWVKCNNPDCGVTYEMDKRDYFEQLEKRTGPTDMLVPPLVCEKCGRESVYRAVKCKNCGYVFFYRNRPGDFADRCPKCRYSETERKRREAAQQRK